MKKMHYDRYVKGSVLGGLKDTPIVFMMGPRQSRKTTLVRELITNKWQYVTLDNKTQLSAAREDPVQFIRSLTQDSAVIDEIQREVGLLLSIKEAVDENRKPGKFLITGSANVMVLPKVSDSLAGRIELVALYPLSECEIKGVKPTFMSKILEGKAPRTSEIRVRKHIIKRIITGCFPEVQQRHSEERIQAWCVRLEIFLVSILQAIVIN